MPPLQGSDACSARDKGPDSRILRPKLREKTPAQIKRQRRRQTADELRGLRDHDGATVGAQGQGKEILLSAVPIVVAPGRGQEPGLEDGGGAGERKSHGQARSAIIDRLKREGAFDLAKPLEDCGAGFGLVCTSCGEIHETVTRCKKRWCPDCARLVSAKRLDKYQKAIAVMQSPIFVTLTMPHKAATSSPEDVRKLRRALGKFRGKKWFRSRVSGGIASIEVTCGDNGWHPHVHMLISAKWLSVTTPPPDRSYPAARQKKMMEDSQREVLWQWQIALGIETGGGVWLSRARPEVAREVLKYAVKPGDLAAAKWPLAPLLRVLGVSRLITTWGTVRKDYQRIASLEKDPEYAGLVCPCGGRDWMPELVLAKIVRDVRERGTSAITAAQNRERELRRAEERAVHVADARADALTNPWRGSAGEMDRLFAR